MLHLRQDAHHAQHSPEGTHENRRPNTFGQGRECTATVEGSVVGAASLRARVILSASASACQVGSVGLRADIGVSKLREEILKDGTRTPMGLELSTKAQLLEVQRHSPLIGSQKAVEQLAGTDTSKKK